MKRTILTLFTCAAIAAPALALEQRTFTSADGSKSFGGRLMDYDAKKGLVVVKKGLRNMKFKLDLLSEKDQEYVKEHANALAAANAIRLDFDLWQGKAATVRTDTERTTTRPAGYEIEVRNWTKKIIQNVEIKYVIFHRKGAEDGPGSIVQTEGSFDISTLFAGKDDLNRTDPVNIVRYSRKKSGGG